MEYMNMKGQRMAHILCWKPTEQVLVDITCRANARMAELFHNMGLEYYTTMLSENDTIMLHLIEHYSSWLEANVGARGVDWHACCMCEPPKAVIAFRKRQHAMTFKLAWTSQSG